jgi:hypothetical protein
MYRDSNPIHWEMVRRLMFHRCSGDGTMRKNIEIWKKWSAGDGNGLHG